MAYLRPILIVTLSMLAFAWSQEVTPTPDKTMAPPYVANESGPAMPADDGKSEKPKQTVPDSPQKLTADDGETLCDATHCWVVPGLGIIPRFNPDAARLAGGTAMEGRLELNHYRSGSYRWGTVCDDFFDNNAATVACRMIGYRNGGITLSHQYGSGSGQIWLDDVICTGRESQLSACSHLAFGSHNCKHREDISIRCFPNVRNPDSARLVGGPSAREGRLEVYHDGTWGTVCDDSFDDKDAKVACRSMGYPNGGTALRNRYGAGTGTIWLDDMGCSSTEADLPNCRSPGWGIHDCSHSEDISIRCNY